MISKGYTSECLVVGGCYCASFNLTMAIVLLCLGCLGAVVKFGHNLSMQSKKEKLYEAAGKFITKIVDRPMPTVDFSAFTTSDEVH